MVVGRGEKIYLWLLSKPLSGGTSYWDDRPPKRGKFEGEPLVHALRVEREHLYRGRKEALRQGRTETYLCLAGASGTHLWWSASTLRLDRDG